MPGGISLSSPTNLVNRTDSLSDTTEISSAFIVWSPVHPLNLNKNVPEIWSSVKDFKWFKGCEVLHEVNLIIILLRSVYGILYDIIKKW